MFTNISVALLLALILPVLAAPSNDWEAIKRGHHDRHHRHTTKSSTVQAYSTGSSLTPSGSAFPTASGSGAASSKPIVPTGTPSSAKSNSTLTPKSTSSSGSGSANPNFLRGINIGGWLLLDKSLNGKLFSGPFSSAIDQWTFDSLPGAAAALEAHYASYFNETHVAQLKSYGINALRIPIGFWAYNATGTPYYSAGPNKGADAYLAHAIAWAASAGMKVWIDLHGSPGSQNGLASSGHTTSAPDWQSPANQAQSLAVLSAIATKYAAPAYAATVIAIELVNEPASADAAKTFAASAASTVRAAAAAAGNADLMLVMQTGSQPVSAWVPWAQRGGKGRRGIDTHMLQTVAAADQDMTQAQHIAAACSRGIALGGVGAGGVGVFVGEWSAGTDVCFDPAGGSWGTGGGGGAGGQLEKSPGTVCTTDPVGEWTAEVVDGVRRYVEAQLEVWETYSAGYFLWSWTDPSEAHTSGLSIVAGMEKGFMPNPLNDIGARKFMGQCVG